MRDEQVRRYARHILLPDVGGLGQTALMVSVAKIELRESEPAAELIATLYLAAGGVGKIMIRGATEAQLADIAAHAGDSTLATEGDSAWAGSSLADGRELGLQPRPAWWPATTPHAGDATALAFWRGGLAALKWMAEIANR